MMSWLNKMIKVCVCVHGLPCSRHSRLQTKNSKLTLLKVRTCSNRRCQCRCSPFQSHQTRYLRRISPRLSSSVTPHGSTSPLIAKRIFLWNHYILAWVCWVVRKRGVGKCPSWLRWRLRERRKKERRHLRRRQRQLPLLLRVLMIMLPRHLQQKVAHCPCVKD